MTGIDAGKSERRLESWKEIAGFFERDEKTVRRWEKDLGLPVHRLPGLSKGRVYAFPEELSAWSKRPREAESTAEHTVESAESLPAPIEIPFLVAPVSVPPLAAAKPTNRALYALLLLPAIILGSAGIGFRLHNRGFFRTVSAGESAHRVNPEAERLYLEGRYYWNERTAAGFTRALDDFTQAIVVDPNYARAYAGLADTYSLTREYTAMPEEEAFPRAYTAAIKAVALDPNLAEAHRALAFPTYWWKRDIPAADREFERAIALNPNDGLAHLWYANELTNSGRQTRALAEINRAQELDPSSSSVRADKGRLLYAAGKKEEAIALLRQMKKNEPAFVSPHRYLGQIYFDEGNYREYLLEARETARLVHRPDDLELVEAEEKGLARDGTRGFLEGMLSAEKNLYAKEKMPAYALAQTEALLGHTEEALRYLRISRERREPFIAGLGRDAALQSLHDDPAFQQLVAEVAFPKLQ